MRLCALLISCLFFLPNSKGQSLVTDDLVCKENVRMLKMVQSRAATPGYYGYDILYHRCEWKVNPLRNKYLYGKVTSIFKTTSAGDSVGFDLMSFMQVDSIHWHGAKTTFTRNGNKILVAKPGSWAKSMVDSLTFFYQGNPDPGGGFGYYNYDNHQTGPIVFTLSEPYGAAYWWPCKQTLSDKIDSIDIIMTIPPSMKAGCNGTLVRNDSINDSTRVMHWKHRYPIATYLVSFAVSNYMEYNLTESWSDRPGTMPIINYVFPQSLAELKLSMPSHMQVLRMFDSLLGHYPFDKEKYGHSQFTWGGGMEHQTMSSVVNFGFDLLAHELAHQWFGDKVTCGSWADLWLNEGFATYMNALCYRYLRTHNDWLGRMRDVRNNALSQDDGSVFARDTNAVNALFSGNLRYNKGAFVLHMLRIKVGDVYFFSALKKYLTQPSTAYGFAKTKDLQRLMEVESGKNLDTFFLRWFWGEGYPKLQINWQQKGVQLKVNIQQTTSHFSVPFFEMPVPVLFKNGQKDTLITFYPSTLNQTFFLSMPFPIDTAVFDPEVTILAKASLGGINLDKTKVGDFLITPNPAQNELVILPFFNLVTAIDIFDISGRKVYVSPPNSNYSVGNKITINIENLSSGTYVTRIYTKKIVNSFKFIKQ